VLEIQDATEELLRFFYIQVDGVRRKSRSTGSSANLEIVCEGIKLVESLFQHYGTETRANFLGPCFYTRQRHLWNSLLYKLRTRLNLTFEHIPEVRVLKSLQGGSKAHVLLDVTIDKADRPADMGKLPFQSSLQC